MNIVHVDEIMSLTQCSAILDISLVSMEPFSTRTGSPSAQSIWTVS